MSEEVVRILLSIALAVISGGIGIATIYLKKRWTASELAVALEKIDAAVRAAEIMGAACGWSPTEKKDWVIERLATVTGLPEDELELFIEAAVARLKTAGEELVKANGAVVPKAEATA